MEEFDDFSLISKLNRQKFLHLLLSVPGDKELAVEQSLLRPLDKLCSMSVLQSHGCVGVHQLLPEFPIAWSDDQTMHRFFFVRPTINFAYRICELIRSSPSYNYVIIICGNRKHFFDRELERNGLFDKVKFFEFDLDFVAIESDLFSLELPQYAPELVDRYYSPMAKSLWKLQVLYGQIQTVYGIGPCFTSIEAHLKQFSTQFGEAFASADQPISHIFLFDRRCDIPSVLLTGLTYESILNDVFNYKCGKISFKETLMKMGDENGDSKQMHMNGVYALNNSDPIFSAIRNAHMTTVFPFLRSRAKMLQTSFDKASGIKKIDEMKDFVSSELRTLKEQQKQLELHIFACEHILKEIQRTAGHRFSMEQAIVRGEFEDQMVFETLLKLIASKCNHWVVLQIACIWSLRSHGLKPKLYRQFRETFLHRYGFEKLTVLYKLRQHFLLVEKENGAPHSKIMPFLGKNSSKDVFYPSTDDSKSTQPFPPTLSNVIAALQLCPPMQLVGDDHKTTGTANEMKRDGNERGKGELERRRRNMAYVFSDAYIPLISHIVHRTVTNGWDEPHLKRLFGEKGVHCSNPDARPPDNRIRRALLVCFVGGVTHAEIASLRRFAQDYDFRLIVLTTHIINREHFLQSYTNL